MNSMQAMVRAYRTDIVGKPVETREPAIRDGELHARLILEEAIETVVALLGENDAGNLIHEASIELANNTYLRNIHCSRESPYESYSIFQNPDLPEAVDGICDLIYVALGAAEGIGIDIEAFFAEVHRSNMMKTSEPVNEHGKRGGKPPGWIKPRIAQMLEEYKKNRGAVEPVPSLEAVA